jgi:DMSO reductase anchor subunit
VTLRRRFSAALFTMWRGMLGDFDVTILDQPASLMMFVFFQFIVVVLMMNLIIAIMGESDQHHVSQPAQRHNSCTEAESETVPER